jgi:hypothetical protein
MSTFVPACESAMTHGIIDILGEELYDDGSTTDCR